MKVTTSTLISSHQEHYNKLLKLHEEITDKMNSYHSAIVEGNIDDLYAFKDALDHILNGQYKIKDSSANLSAEHSSLKAAAARKSGKLYVNGKWMTEQEVTELPGWMKKRLERHFNYTATLRPFKHLLA